MMSEGKDKSFSEKHDPNANPDPTIEKEMQKRGAGQEIACTVAFDIAKALGVPPMDVGRTADLMNVPVVKCQLGLFGYKPEKKIVKAEDTSNEALREAIIGSATDNRLSCEKAWEIADRFDVGKKTVSNAGQANGIKIKTCQLGAFP